MKLYRRVRRALGTAKEGLKGLFFFRRLTSYLFGDDVFISYSRLDGAAYAEKLANRLSSREEGISCRMDILETRPGGRIPKVLLRGLRMSRLLVVVGTEQALGSWNIRREIRFYTRTHAGGANIVPIDFGAGRVVTPDAPRGKGVPCADGCVMKPPCAGVCFKARPWIQLVEGIPNWPRENPEALGSGNPDISEEVLNRIRGAATFTRRNQRLNRLSVAIASSFVLLVAAVVGTSLWATRTVRAAEHDRDAAQRDAAEAGAQAEKSRGEAFIQALEALTENMNARIQAIVAEQRRAEAAAADEQRKVAEARAATARERERRANETVARQNRLAFANDLAARAEEIRAASPAELEKSAQLAREAVHRLHRLGVSSPNAERTLRRDLRLLPTFKTQTDEHGEVLALSPDGRHLVYGNYQYLRVRNLESGREFQLPSEVGGADAVAFVGDDGKLLATARTLGLVQVWENWDDAARVRSVNRITFTGSFTPGWQQGYQQPDIRHEDHIAFSPDGRHFAYVRDSGPVSVWAVETSDQRVVELPAIPRKDVSQGGGGPASHVVQEMAVSNGGRLIAAAYSDAVMRICAVEGTDASPHPCREVASFPIVSERHFKNFGREPKRRWTLAVAWSWKGRYLAVTTSENRVDVFDAEAGYRSAARFVYDEAVASSVLPESLAFSVDERYLASGGGDMTPRLWDVEASVEVARARHPSRLRAVALGRDARQLAAGGETGSAVVWDLSSNLANAAFPAETFVLAEISPDARLAAVADTRETRVWDLASREQQGEPLSHTPTPEMAARAVKHNSILSYLLDRPSHLFFSQNGTYLAELYVSHINLWRLSPRREFLGAIGGVSNLSFSRDERFLALRGTFGRAFVYEVGKLKHFEHAVPVEDFKYFTQVLDVKLSHDGRFAVVENRQYRQGRSADDPGVTVPGGTYLCEVGSCDSPASAGVVELVPPGEDGLVEWAPEGGLLAVANRTRRSLSLYDTAKRQFAPHATRGLAVTAMKFDRAGKRLAAAGGSELLVLPATGGAARRWDVGEPAAIIDWAQDGRHFMTSYQDNSAQVWDSVTLRKVAHLRFDEGAVAKAFSPGGEAVISVLGNRVETDLWKADDLSDEVCRRITSALPPDAWGQYLKKERPFAPCPGKLPAAMDEAAWPVGLTMK